MVVLLQFLSVLIWGSFLVPGVKVMDSIGTGGPALDVIAPLRASNQGYVTQGSYNIGEKAITADQYIVLLS